MNSTSFTLSPIRVRVRNTKNISQSRKFSEMIDTAVTKYHNNQINSVQVLEELAKNAREMRVEDKKVLKV